MLKCGRYILQLCLSGVIFVVTVPTPAQFFGPLPISASTVAPIKKLEKAERDAVKRQYLKDFAAYLSAMVYAQGLDLQEQISCLKEAALRESSSFCQSFIFGTPELPMSDFESLLQAYLHMRKYLALATTASVRGAPAQGLDRYGYPLHVERGPELHHLFDRFRLNFLSDLPPVPNLPPLQPEEKVPLDSLLSVNARAAAENFYVTSGLEEAPLVWEEALQERRAQAQALLENGDGSLESFIAWDEAQRELDMELEENLRAYLEMYRFSNAAALSHAITSGFTNLENENRVRYYQVIQEFPVVAFMELSSEQVRALVRQSSTPEFFFPAVAKALESTLEVNQSYYRHLLSMQQEESLGKLVALLDLKPLVETYFDEDVHDMEIVEELVASNEWREIQQDLKTVAVGVAWGFTCGAILAWGYGRIASWGLSAALVLAGQTAITIQCALTSGLGLNAIFYSNSHKRYHQTFQEFFAVSGLDKRDRYKVLQEISQLEERDQAMLFESLFLFVGTGAGESARRLLSPSSQQTFMRWLQAAGAE